MHNAQSPEYYRGVLFDLDGVLVDSEGAYTLFWEQIDRLYPTGIPDFAQAIKGTNLAMILSHFATDGIRADVRRRIHEYEQTMDYPLYPGARELLETLASRGVPTAIVTSSDDVKMRHLYRRHPWLRTVVRATVDGSMVERSKPDPLGYQIGARLLGLAPEECIVVEDSLQGLEAGRRAGAHVVGIATTNPAEAVEGRCDEHFADIAAAAPRLLALLA